MDDSALPDLGLSAREVLTTTRSVRRRLDLSRPVEREVIRDAIEVAIQAPTGSNAQAWHWVIVEDPAKKAALAELYGANADPYFEILSGTDSSQFQAIVDSAVYLRRHLHQVPAMVIPCLWGRIPDGVDNAMAAAFYGSILPAAWSFMLALRSRGLGSAWTTLHLGSEREAAEVLGIPYDRCSQVALLPVAYTVGTEFHPARRAPLDSVLHWDQW
ncbi:MAG: nitroreductase family protein [Microthrixaceae bacterium]|nr:nitroreductase family protein [Microthrixaceae bacterium]